MTLHKKATQYNTIKCVLDMTFTSFHLITQIYVVLFPLNFDHVSKSRNDGFIQFYCHIPHFRDIKISKAISLAISYQIGNFVMYFVPYLLLTKVYARLLEAREKLNTKLDEAQSGFRRG